MTALGGRALPMMDEYGHLQRFMGRTSWCKMPVLVRFTLVLRVFSANLVILRKPLWKHWNVICISLAVQKHINNQRIDPSHVRETMATRVCCMSLSKSFLAFSSAVNSFFGFSLGFLGVPLGAPKRSESEEGVLAILVSRALAILNRWALFCGMRDFPASPIPVLVSSALVSSIRSNTLYKRFFGFSGSWGCGFPTWP